MKRLARTWKHLTPEKVAEIRRRYAEEDISQEELAWQMGTTQSTVSKIVRGATWKNVKEEISA